MGFIIHFYIIFGTNLLTQRPSPDCCFLPISGFCRKRISNGVQTEWNLRERYFWRKSRTGNVRTKSGGKGPALQGGAPPFPGHAPASRLAHTAPGALLLPIYTYVPQKLHTQRENPNSTAVASVPVEIPSWSLFWEGDPSRRPSSSSSSPSPWVVSSLPQTFGSIASI